MTEKKAAVWATGITLGLALWMVSWWINELFLIIPIVIGAVAIVWLCIWRLIVGDEHL